MLLDSIVAASKAWGLQHAGEASFRRISCNKKDCGLAIQACGVLCEGFRGVIGHNRESGKRFCIVYVQLLPNLALILQIQVYQNTFLTKKVLNI